MCPPPHPPNIYRAIKHAGGAFPVGGPGLWPGAGGVAEQKYVSGAPLCTETQPVVAEVIAFRRVHW
jgi:hypothetical protein